MLIPDPAGMLITQEWPAPAVVTWKAVAEALSGGLSTVPEAALPAMAVAALVGVAMALAEEARWGRWLPSAPAAGLAFVIPAANSISLFLGAALAAALAQCWPQAARRFTLPLAAGLVAGESLTGVGQALWSMLAVD